MASRLLLIRHAETEAAQKKKLVGSTEVDITPAALQRLARFDELLSSYAPQQWFSSPMKRALQSTSAIVEACGIQCEIVIDERLREIDFGRWEMKTTAEIFRAEPGMIEAWAEYDNFTFPEGEAVRDFVARVGDVFSVFRRLPAGEIAVVTHGGVIRTMICLALGQSPKNYLQYSVHPGTLAILDIYSEGAVLRGLNL